MSQFDVFINPSQSTRDAFPFIVDIQHPIISDISTRIVLPLGKFSYFKNESIRELTPVIEYNNEKLLLLTTQIASIPARKLKNPVGTLSNFRDEIIASLDFAITGI